jgi:hypothetical protein
MVAEAVLPGGGHLDVAADLGGTSGNVAEVGAGRVRAETQESSSGIRFDRWLKEKN